MANQPYGREVRLEALDRAIKLADVWAGWGDGQNNHVDSVIESATKIEAYINGAS